MFDKVVFPQASILLEQARAEKREAYKREHIITRSYNTYSLTLYWTFLADKLHECKSIIDMGVAKRGQGRASPPPHVKVQIEVGGDLSKRTPPHKSCRKLGIQFFS